MRTEYADKRKNSENTDQHNPLLFNSSISVEKVCFIFEHSNNEQKRLIRCSTLVDLIIIGFRIFISFFTLNQEVDYSPSPTQIQGLKLIKMNCLLTSTTENIAIDICFIPYIVIFYM